jgi:hypothetical protein
MYQDSALVERPSCSSTRNHSVCDQPWPPCSGEWSPPERPAAMASLLILMMSSSGIRPPLRSASSSFEIRTSSVKRRARCRSSSGVNSAAGAAGVTVTGFLRSVRSAGLSCAAWRVLGPDCHGSRGLRRSRRAPRRAGRQRPRLVLAPQPAPGRRASSGGRRGSRAAPPEPALAPRARVAGSRRTGAWQSPRVARARVLELGRAMRGGSPVDP